ncbi:SGNH/GDSL hydrolase family protein [Actinomycetes bacterium KLBMP 9797]
MRRLSSPRLAVLRLAVPVLAVALVSGGSAAAGSGGPTGGWVSTWTGSAMAPSALVSSVQELADQTVRNIVHTSAGGSELRVRVSNAFGDRPVTVGAATVGRQLRDAQVDQATLRGLTFAGRAAVRVPEGGSVVSDPVRMPVPALTNLAVSLYLPEPTGPATYHQAPMRTNYLAAGDHAADAAAGAFGTTVGTWFFVDAIQVRGRAPGTIVALGDSITDGVGGQHDANTRWPNYLARRLTERYGSGAPAVIGAGISGNRVLNDSTCFGERLLDRLDRDVFSQPGVHTVVLLEGINDLGFSQSENSGCTAPNTNVSVAQLVAAYRQIIDRAHARGIRVYGGTLTPAQGFFYWDDAAERKRREVNAWIRTSRAFDGVVDFAAVMAYPGHPELLDPKYDSGDHLHPNDAGFEAMAAAAARTLRLS